MEQRNSQETTGNKEAFWREKIEKEIKSLLELIETDFFEVGDYYGVEQFLEDPDSWGSMNVDEQQVLLGTLGEYLNVDLSDFSSEQIVGNYHEEGIVGQPTEGGAEVVVLRTKFPQLNIYVFDYANPEVGRRYDLVRVE